MKQKPWIWWHLRITFETMDVLMKYAEDLQSKMIQISSQYLAVKELSEKEKPHIHMNFLSNLSESKLRDFLIPPNLPKMSKYLKEIPEDEISKTDCYICKGEHECPPEIILKSNVKYTTEYLQKCNKDYWEIYSKLMKNKKSKNCTFIDLVVNDLKTNFKDKIWNSTSLVDRRIVLNYILDMLGKKGKGFDSIILKRLMNGVLNILDRHGMKAYMESLIFDYSEKSMLGID